MPVPVEGRCPGVVAAHWFGRKAHTAVAGCSRCPVAFRCLRACVAEGLVRVRTFVIVESLSSPDDERAGGATGS